jgi:hypothetical protein
MALRPRLTPGLPFSADSHQQAVVDGWSNKLIQRTASNRIRRRWCWEWPDRPAVRACGHMRTPPEQVRANLEAAAVPDFCCVYAPVAKLNCRQPGATPIESTRFESILSFTGAPRAGGVGWWAGVAGSSSRRLQPGVIEQTVNDQGSVLRPEPIDVVRKD